MINPMKYSDNSSMKRTSMTGTLAKSTKKSPTIFNSTPDNLDSFNSTEYGVMGWPGSNNELNGWQSSDGLTTPISISGRSPLHTPGYTPLHTPLRTLYSLMHPPSTPSMGGHQGTPSTPSARTARIRKSSFRGSDSMFIFRDVSGTSSPRKVTTPTPGGRSGQGSQNLSGNKYRRFHSVPRSSTIDGIVDSSSSPRHNGVEHQGMIYSTNERTVQMHYSIPATNSSVPNSKSLGIVGDSSVAILQTGIDNLSSRGSPVGHYLNMGRVASKQSIDGGSNNNSRQQSTETLHKIGGGGGENGLPNPAGVQWTPPGKTLYRQHYAPGPGLMQRSSTTVGFLEGYSKKYDIYGGVNGVRKQASDYGVVPPLRQSSFRQTTVNMGQVTPSRQTQSGILGFSASKVPNGGGSSDYLNMQNLLKTKD